MCHSQLVEVRPAPITTGRLRKDAPPRSRILSGIRVSPQASEALFAAAAEQNVSVSALVRGLIEQVYK